MNVLQVLPELNLGGVETGVVDLVKQLTDKGHKAVVISSGGSLVKKVEEYGGIHYRLPVHNKNPVAILKMVKKIEQIIQREKIEVVHARSRAPAYSAFLASYRQKVPLVTTCHGYYSRHITSRVMGWGKFVIVASHVIARHMIEDFGVPKERIRLIPRGVNLDNFPYNPVEKIKHKDFVIGMIGRITPLKGHTHFIRAVSKVIRSIPRIQVIIAGEAPPSKQKYMMELQTLVKRLSLTKYVKFLGQQDDISALLKNMDVLVLATTTPEAFGRVIIEAQASGVPVVATKVGGVVDIIRHEKNGLLVNPSDWASMADAIMGILQDRALANRLATQARKDVERNFNLKRMYKKTIAVYKDARDLLKILVIKLGATGDVILNIPVLKALRGHFPRAKIVVLAKRKSKEVVNNCPYVDEIIVYDRMGLNNRFQRIKSISAELRQEHFDIVMDFQNNRISHLLSLLSASPRRIGYKTGKFDFVLTDAFDGARDVMPPVEHQFRLLRTLGIKGEPEKLQLFYTESDRLSVDKKLSDEWVSEKQILVGINIGSSQNWEAKRWPIENFAKLCHKFSQKDIRAVITGTKQDIQAADKLISFIGAKPVNMVGKTSLMELVCLIERCKLFITGDSAPLHIAQAIATPHIVFFGPTDPKRHCQPSKDTVIIQKRLKCAPCYKRDCSTKKCMTKISVEEVFKIAMDMLGKKG